MNQSEHAIESRARRAARNAEMIARKSKWRKYSYDNEGEFMLLDARTGIVVAGHRFDMSAEEVIAYCASEGEQ